MSELENLKKLESIINSTFDTSYSIEASTSAEDIDEWDSISHIELIGQIEEEFKIRFALSELQDLKNVGEMANLISEKLA